MPMIVLHHCTVRREVENPAMVADPVNNPVKRTNVEVQRTSLHFSLGEAAEEVALEAQSHGMEGRAWFFQVAHELNVSLIIGGERSAFEPDEDDQPEPPV